MFSKSFRVKTNTQLKGSERKALRAKISSCFPDLKEDILQNVLPLKSAITAMKVYTYTQEIVIVYCAQKLPIFFEVEQSVYPSLYTLWQYPDFLPTFTTHAPVLPKLVGGADLMIPGVVLPESCGHGTGRWGNFEKGAKVAVNLTNNKAAVGVGKTAHSSIDMFMSGGRGHCVKILHIFGDKLWGFDQTVTQQIPQLGPPDWLRETSEPTVYDNISVDKITSELPIIMDQMTVTEICSNQCNIDENEASANSSPHKYEATDISEPSEQIDPAVIMDEALLYAFLKSLKLQGKKLQLPLLTSNFYKLHMIPASPQDQVLDVKKSTYKKLSKFLAAMAAAGLIDITEQTKGVEVIKNVTLDHPQLREFIPAERMNITQNSETENPGFVSKFTELLSVTKLSLPIFAHFGLQTGDCMTSAEVRKYVTEYVKQENLQDPNNKKLVLMNGVLCDLCNNTLLTMNWETLFSRIESRLSPAYEMRTNDSLIHSKGKLQCIEITIGKRSGNKKVTLIDNLELFGIRVADFARTCQHGVAASTSITRPPGKKSDQVLVQGNQVLFIEKLLLEQYKIPKRYIKGLELAPKKRN